MHLLNAPRLAAVLAAVSLASASSGVNAQTPSLPPGDTANTARGTTAPNSAVGATPATPTVIVVVPASDVVPANVPVASQTATNTPAEATPGTAQIARTPPVSTPAPATAAVMAAPRSMLDGFSFGSYGRVVVASDLRGHSGRSANIVAHGTRIDEQTYAELEMHRDDDFGAVHTRVVFTLAIMGPLFHETGNFGINLAVRNLYIEERGAFLRGLALWMGSRMYRGDDAYLLNWWPLDNLNTVGGGARYDANDYFTVAAHIGTNRLDSSYQYQQIAVTPRNGIGATRVVLLDRPRVIGSLKATLWLMGRTARTGVKIAGYFEGHGLPEGVRRNNETGRLELLPADSGVVAGLQVGAYTTHNTFVNLWLRYGQGLGAYGDLAVPYTLTARQTSVRARDLVLAMAANYENGPFGVLLGAYMRSFHDADTAVYGRNSMLEGTVVVRPSVWIGDNFGLAVEGSYQAVSYNALDPSTGEGAAGGSLWRLAVMPYVTPAGRGNFTRPHLRIIYAVTFRDPGAQRLYAPEDPFARNSVEHFLGLGSEWWFNSSYL